jgi:hypothetical protein
MAGEGAEDGAAEDGGALGHMVVNISLPVEVMTLWKPRFNVVVDDLYHYTLPVDGRSVVLSVAGSAGSVGRAGGRARSGGPAVSVGDYMYSAFTATNMFPGSHSMDLFIEHAEHVEYVEQYNTTADQPIQGSPGGEHGRGERGGEEGEEGEEHGEGEEGERWVKWGNAITTLFDVVPAELAMGRTPLPVPPPSSSTPLHPPPPPPPSSPASSSSSPASDTPHHNTAGRANDELLPPPLPPLPPPLPRILIVDLFAKLEMDGQRGVFVEQTKHLVQRRGFDVGYFLLMPEGEWNKRGRRNHKEGEAGSPPPSTATIVDPVEYHAGDDNRWFHATSSSSSSSSSTSASSSSTPKTNTSTHLHEQVVGAGARLHMLPSDPMRDMLFLLHTVFTNWTDGDWGDTGVRGEVNSDSSRGGINGGWGEVKGNTASGSGSDDISETSIETKKGSTEKGSAEKTEAGTESENEEDTSRRRLRRRRRLLRLRSALEDLASRADMDEEGGRVDTRTIIGTFDGK